MPCSHYNRSYIQDEASVVSFCLSSGGSWYNHVALVVRDPPEEVLRTYNCSRVCHFPEFVCVFQLLPTSTVTPLPFHFDM